MNRQLQATAIDGVHMWSRWLADRGAFANAFFIASEEGNLIIDPIELPLEADPEIAALGGIAFVFHADPARSHTSHEFAKRFKAKLVSAEEIAASLTGFQHIPLPGFGAGGASALALPSRKAVIVSGALRGVPAGAITLADDASGEETKTRLYGLRRVWALRPDALLFGEGSCIFAGADRALGNFLQSRSEVYVNRINFDEVPPRQVPGPGGYDATVQEIGNAIGARLLGYWLVELAPGMKFCPLHAHQREEEMFLVWEGRPTVRTPRGTFECRRGDVVAFPPGDEGTHQLLNASDEPCKVFLLGMDEPQEVAYYPDSDKVLVRGRNRLIVRASPRLDYYDGEV